MTASAMMDGIKNNHHAKQENLIVSFRHSNFILISEDVKVFETVQMRVIVFVDFKIPS